MEPLFINKITNSKKFYIEMGNATSVLITFVSGTVLLILYFILSAVLYLYTQYLAGSIIIAVIGIAVTIIPILLKHYITSKNEKRWILLYNCIPEVTTNFHENKIFRTSKTTKEELDISYDKIIKVKQSKNLYLLILSEKLVIMIDKNRFEKGNCTDFEEFIKEKAFNAKIKL